MLLHDEIKIKSDLVHCKHTRQLIGFANLGQANNALVDVEKQLEDEYTNGIPDIASYMLVFMVRGITTRLEYPLAHSPCSGCITADFIFPLLWEAVKHLETIGLKVIASTSDGASSNRKFIKMHKPPKSAKEIELYKTKNIYSPEERDFFFISDVPHLIKTVRNNWENSGWNKKTRELRVKTCILTIYIVLYIDNFQTSTVTVHNVFCFRMEGTAFLGYMLLTYTKMTLDAVDYHWYQS